MMLNVVDTIEAQEGPPPLAVELVPRTCWYSNVRSNVTRAQWEKCKTYARTKTQMGGTAFCWICGMNGIEQGYRYEVEAHEIWHYDDDKLIQTLVDIVPLCPMCHHVKHLGRSRDSMDFQAFHQLVTHLQRVNGWSTTYLELYVNHVFTRWLERSEHEWELDISFLEKAIGIAPKHTDRSA